ncbi:MAG: hypothetical protein GEU73_10670 [Chloroflexi bacterium]|nr:hypothetical protein [Chloroflexota bacterium]
MEGIRDGKAREAVQKYTGARYTQHSTGVADSKEGFIAFFEPFLQGHPVRDVRVVRAFEDEQYVFLHVFQSLDGGQATWVTMDLFDTDEQDLIIEHWDVITPYLETTVSGHSQVDGPAAIVDLDRTEANKALVGTFVSQVLQGGRVDRITDFVSAETYIQHNPHVGDGLDGLRAFLAQLAGRGEAMVYEKVFKLVGCGNFVTAYSQVKLGAQPYAVFDLFRVDNGLMVEHWDAMEPLPSPEQARNSGKF